MPNENKDDQPGTRTGESSARRGARSLVVAGAALVGVVGGGIAASAFGGAGATTQPQAESTAAAPAGGDANAKCARPDGRGGHLKDRGTAGTISAVSGSTITVKNAAGKSVKVVTTADTKVIKATKGAISDIEVGDNVAVRGGGNSAAKEITTFGTAALPERRADAPEPPAAPEGEESKARRGAIGKVTEVSATSITVKTASGDAKLKIDGDTAVVKVAHLKVTELKVGDKVAAVGEKADDGTVTAVRIMTGDGSLKGEGSGPLGRPGMRPRR